MAGTHITYGQYFSSLLVSHTSTRGVQNNHALFHHNFHIYQIVSSQPGESLHLSRHAQEISNNHLNFAINHRNSLI